MFHFLRKKPQDQTWNFLSYPADFWCPISSFLHEIWQPPPFCWDFVRKTTGGFFHGFQRCKSFSIDCSPQVLAMMRAKSLVWATKTKSPANEICFFPMSERWRFFDPKKYMEKMVVGEVDRGFLGFILVVPWYPGWTIFFWEQIIGGGEVDRGFLLGTSPYYLHEYVSRMTKKGWGKKP